MNCQSCGRALADTAKFCPGCGTKVEQTGASAAQAATQQPYAQAPQPAPPQAAPPQQQFPQPPQQQPLPMQQQPAPQMPVPGGAQQGILGKRILAYLIDGLLMMVVCLIPILGWIAVVVYGLVKDALFDGRSLGKKAMGIRVINLETGQPADFKDSILRNIVYFIPFFTIVELIILISRSGESRLGDDWFKTKVILAP